MDGDSRLQVTSALPQHQEKISIHLWKNHDDDDNDNFDRINLGHAKQRGDFVSFIGHESELELNGPELIMSQSMLQQNPWFQDEKGVSIHVVPTTSICCFPQNQAFDSLLTSQHGSISQSGWEESASFSYQQQQQQKQKKKHHDVVVDHEDYYFHQYDRRRGNTELFSLSLVPPSLPLFLTVLFSFSVLLAATDFVLLIWLRRYKLRYCRHFIVSDSLSSSFKVRIKNPKKECTIGAAMPTERKHNTRSKALTVVESTRLFAVPATASSSSLRSNPEQLPPPPLPLITPVAVLPLLSTQEESLDIETTETFFDVLPYLSTEDEHMKKKNVDTIIEAIEHDDDETADVTEDTNFSARSENASEGSGRSVVKLRVWSSRIATTLTSRLEGMVTSMLRGRGSQQAHHISSCDAFSMKEEQKLRQEQDILQQTQHGCWAGDGILASQKDLDVSIEEFAAGCGLIQAAARGDIATMERLVDPNQPHPTTYVNFRDYDRRTALHVAASEGRLKVCKWLIEKHRARVNRSDRWGGTPLDDAYRHRQDDVIQYLREKGAMTGSRNRSINLIQAAADGDLEEVQLLLSLEEAAAKTQSNLRRTKHQQQQRLDLNRGNHDKRTALHFAASQGCTDIVKILLEKGADVCVIDRHGKTPLDDALDGGHQDCVVLLSTYGSMTRGRSRTPRASPDKPDNNLINTNLEIDYSELEMIKRIGAGSFGAIYKCRWRGTLVAAKIIKTAQIQHDWLQAQMKTKALLLKQDDSMGDIDPSVTPQNEMELALADFRKEIEFVKSFRHPNIVLMLAYSTTKRHECLISELCKCSLLDLLRAHTLRGSRLPRRTQFVYAQQLAQGMNYLHTCNPPVIHRDLKPANILIDHSGTLKISDFGLSRIRPNPGQMTSDTYEMTGETGSYRYMAPEVFRHEQYNEQVDVYSFAMIIFYMMSGRPPWPSLPGFEAVRLASERGDRPVIPREVDGRSANLLKLCWHSDPLVRPSFRKILSVLHVYMEDVFDSDSNSVAIAVSPDLQQKWACTIL